ncbi:MAG: hypothetical protein KGJ07_03430 [Patescibacteria group bacterium]|nr:hypothetical protein [Patescibacteria group bacterium]
MINKKIFVSVISLTLAGAIFFGVNQFARAQSNGGQTLVQMIAQTFGLDQSKVQAVFDTYKNQHKALMQTNMMNRLKTHFDQLVSQGKMTLAQETAILAELQKVRSEFNPQSLRNMTPVQRQQAFQQEQNELQSWAKSQGIDPLLLQSFGGINRGLGMHYRWGMMGGPQITPTPTQ